MAVSGTSAQQTVQNIITAGAGQTSGRKVGDLGKDDFLKLMVTQLKYQDPMNPQDDKEFLGQMAQFTALEQMQNLNASSTHSQAFSLMGKQVTGSIIDEKTLETKVVSGVVSGVKINSGKTILVIDDKELPIESVTGVKEASTTSTSTNDTATNNGSTNTGTSTGSDTSASSSSNATDSTENNTTT